MVSGIIQDAIKYYCVISAFTSDILNYASNIVLPSPQTDKYQTLKARLVSDFSDSQQR